MIKEEQVVIIVGAGPSGISTSACLNRLSIPNTLLERDDCFASLWNKKAYDRLHLHLHKQFCQLPHMPFPHSFPTYIPKTQFLEYMDQYVAHFDVSPKYNRRVESAEFEPAAQRWHVKARVGGSDEAVVEKYVARFLVVATGETSDPLVPSFEGVERFEGEVLHSTEYRSGEKYRHESVLVVGSGNSGMEIALDLCNYGAKTAVVVRSPVHVLNREMVNMGLKLLKCCVPLNVVDGLLVMLSKLVYGDLSMYGIVRPKEEGPFLMKLKYGKYPVIDLGTINKIKCSQIQVLPSIKKINRNEVEFANGKSWRFDAIVFATGFKRSTNKWLKDVDNLLDKDGIPKHNFPNHWKGRNGLYCVGLSRMGLYGLAMDAEHVAKDIKALV